MLPATKTPLRRPYNVPKQRSKERRRTRHRSFIRTVHRRFRTVASRPISTDDRHGREKSVIILLSSSSTRYTSLPLFPAHPAHPFDSFIVTPFFSFSFFFSSFPRYIPRYINLLYERTNYRQMYVRIYTNMYILSRTGIFSYTSSPVNEPSTTRIA